MNNNRLKYTLETRKQTNKGKSGTSNLGWKAAVTAMWCSQEMQPCDVENQEHTQQQETRNDKSRNEGEL